MLSNIELGFGQLSLSAMCEPSRDARYSEQKRVKVGRETQSPINNTTVKIYVRIESTSSEVFILKCTLFELFGHKKERLLDFDQLENLLHLLFKNASSWIKRLVHSMPESKKALLLRLHALEKRLDVLNRMNALELSYNRFGGAAVTRLRRH